MSVNRVRNACSLLPFVIEVKLKLLDFSNTG